MGCYPLFLCQEWSRLAEDLLMLQRNLISLVLVTDPFGDFDVEQLEGVFDVCVRFKEHFITDLSQPLQASVRKGHRQAAHRSLRDIDAEHCTNPIDHLQAWKELYGYLIERHGISGMRAFSQESFRRLLTVPGIEMFIARHGDLIVGAQIWSIQGDVGYVHLTAVNPTGYKLAASYALRWVAMNHFQNRLRWVDHGAAAGLNEVQNGLATFKGGWATETRPVYLCGRILDRERYAELASASEMPNSTYFPIYRAGEFA
jgi:hypothetical protein